MTSLHLKFLAPTLAAIAFSGTCSAEGDHRPSIPALPAYAQECGSCHIAYPPSLLPGASWQRLMGNLKRHFGSDASLDPATTQALTTWLNANAATRSKTRAEPPQDRITLAPWFQREHREVAAASWQRASIKSASNCSACHPQAAQGDFNEHQVRIPR